MNRHHPSCKSNDLELIWLCHQCGGHESAKLNKALYPTMSGFADWYALHGIPLGIGRDNARVFYDAAVKGFEHVVFVADSPAFSQTLERIVAAFGIVYAKWLSEIHSTDMNEAIEAMARELGSPICPDCKCELVKPGNTCSFCGWEDSRP